MTIAPVNFKTYISMKKVKMKISILGTGSSGNSIYIEDDKNKILIDAGFSGKKMAEKLGNINRNLDDINALLISHEHGDHTLGAGIIARRHKIPIYISKESYDCIKDKLGEIPENLLNFIEGDICLNDLNIKSIDVSHDAIRTMAFKIENSHGKKIGVATDVGKINNILKYDFRDLNLLVLESNYDFNMLMECSYPQDLKMRIKSNRGHLCNSDSGKFIADIYHHYLEKVFLAHISNDSNCPKVAKETVINELIQRGIDIDSNFIEAVPQGIYTKLYEIK